MEIFFFMNTAKNNGTLPNPLVRKSSANGQLPQILEQFARKSAETIHRRKISTPGRYSGNLRIESYVCYYLIMPSIQRRFIFFNKICLI